MEAFVEVWSVSLSCEPGECRALFELLSPEERDRARRYRNAEERARFIKSRAILRKILALRTGLAPETLRIAPAPGGKPFLANAPGPVFFNVSHSRDVALYAVSRDAKVGVDVEWVDPEVDFWGVAVGVFTPAECARLQREPCASQNRLFYRMWTSKEARLKAMGCGLGISSECVEKEGCGSWPIANLLVAPEYMATLACPCPFRFALQSSPALVNFLSDRL